MPDLPLDPPPDGPLKSQLPRPPAAAVSSDGDRNAQHYSQRDILAMYPALRLDHLRYLEKCALIKPVHRAGRM